MWDMAGDDYSKGTPVGWRLPVATKDRFVDFCGETSLGVENSCAGALVVWQFLSPNVQQQAIKAARGLAEPAAVLAALQADGLARQTSEAALHDTEGPRRSQASKPQAREASERA